MAGHGNSIVLFNDGEEVVQGDFNALQNALTERAWEIPGYHDLVAFDQFGTDYNTALIGGDGRKYGVYTKGGGLLPSYDGPYGRTSSLTGGLLGIWATPLVGNPNVDSTVARAMRWVSLWGGEWSYLHDATTSGQYRIDIVTCAVNEAASGTLVSRSFQDATTGALTSIDVDKQTSLTLDLASATAVTKGAEAASEAAAVIPAIPTGRRILYYVVVHNTAITSMHDCTIPAGSLITNVMFPTQGYSWASAWTVSGGLSITATGNNSTVLMPPQGIAGDPSVRILGFTFEGTLQATDVVQMAMFDWTAGTWTLVGPALSAQFARSGAPELKTIDLRGKPAATGSGPIWGNGWSTKVVGTVTTVGIYVWSAAGSTTVKSVNWYAVRG